MDVADSGSVAHPSEGHQSYARQNGKAPAQANGKSDDAISVGEFTKGGRGSGESEAVGEDERQGQPRLGKEGGQGEAFLMRALDRVDDLQARLNLQRDETVYWRGMYKIMVRVIAEQHDDPAFAWMDEVVHHRFSAIFHSERGF